MATYKKLPSGKWQAQIARNGVRKSASFNTKREAQDWAARHEYLAVTEETPKGKDTFAEVLLRYARDISPSKRGARWEIIQINRFARSELAKKQIASLRPSDFAAWRDARLKEVAPATVNREMTILSAVLHTARREWGLITQSPLTDVRKPSPPPPRDRRVSQEEIDKLLATCGTDLAKVSARVIHAFRFAIETAMRAGEIVSLTSKDVNFETRVATLEMTKNGTARKVPLSTAAISLLNALPENEGTLFGITSAQADALFRKTRDRAKIENLHFHDSRHEAITRLAKKLDVLALARVVGHKDIRMLQVYYNESAEELAQLLD